MRRYKLHALASSSSNNLQAHLEELRSSSDGGPVDVNVRDR